MNTYRKSARIVAILFITALTLDLIGRALYEPILNDPEYLTSAQPNRIQLIIGIVLEFLCVPAIVLIPIFLFSVLRKYNKNLALGYVGFRLLEGMLFIYLVINSFSLLSLSQAYINAESTNASFFETLGDSIHATNYWSTLIYIIVFTLGAWMFYYMLYKSKLLPRFISIWGLIATALLLIGALCALFDFISLSKVMNIFGPPVGLNEITLSIWLFFKGFNLSLIESA